MILFKVLSRKLPYWQYAPKEIKSAVLQGELPKRPYRMDGDMDEIDDQAWDLITKCCAHDPQNRPEAPEVHDLIANMKIGDDRPEANCLFIPEVLALRSRPNVDFDRVKALLDPIQASGSVCHGYNKR
jgi:serine/threonine protein kinase